jgi:hypothetical protein
MSAEKVNDFKKAFSACLEAKKYTVRYESRAAALGKPGYCSQRPEILSSIGFL